VLEDKRMQGKKDGDGRDNKKRAMEDSQPVNRLVVKDIEILCECEIDG
jgi:hypothetical protein